MEVSSIAYIKIVIPKPVIRGSSGGGVSKHQRMKPRTRGAQARQEFIGSKQKLPAREGDLNGTQRSIPLFLLYLLKAHFLLNIVWFQLVP